MEEIREPYSNGRTPWGEYAVRGLPLWDRGQEGVEIIAPVASAAAELRMLPWPFGLHVAL